MHKTDMASSQPHHQTLEFSKEEVKLLKPFFTNLDKPVFSIPFLPPEVIGALCSRASRAKGDLREIFLHEFLKPFLENNDDYSKSLKELIKFLHKNPWELIFSNPKGRDFYVKWLAQYGDDSIAQMSGTHLLYSDLSLVAIKHFERMRVGLAPIEKSTRYVDYSTKTAGKYRYYVDPTLAGFGLKTEYIKAMDGLFDTYKELIEKYLVILQQQYPDETKMVLRTKAFDVVRGLLPTSTLSQVAFYGNGQAFEYAISRSLQHPLSEVRWAGQAGWEELDKVIPAFLRRLDSEASKTYQKYLSGLASRIEAQIETQQIDSKIETSSVGVKLLDYDKQGENKIITALLYPQLHKTHKQVYALVSKMSHPDKKAVIEQALAGRTQRFYKVPRAFEEASMKFEVTANWGVWKDLQRHRMLTTYRERFSVHHGFDVPPELIETNLDGLFIAAVRKVEKVFSKIEKKDPDLAQYAVTQAHRLRFIQHQNLRSLFWTTELRTIAQGHPDYRFIEQEKAKLIQKHYPILGEFLLVDMNDYVFARRDTSKAIVKKEAELKEYLSQK